jgi:hypothetical protein
MQRRKGEEEIDHPSKSPLPPAPFPLFSSPEPGVDERNVLTF